MLPDEEGDLAGPPDNRFNSFVHDEPEAAQGIAAGRAKKRLQDEDEDSSTRREVAG